MPNPLAARPSDSAIVELTGWFVESTAASKKTVRAKLKPRCMSQAPTLKAKLAQEEGRRPQHSYFCFPTSTSFQRLRHNSQSRQDNEAEQLAVYLKQQVKLTPKKPTPGRLRPHLTSRKYIIFNTFPGRMRSNRKTRHPFDVLSGRGLLPQKLQ